MQPIRYLVFPFSATHVLRRADWTEAENTAQFGPCCKPNGHGHNFYLTVAFSIAAHSVAVGTGTVIDIFEGHIAQHLHMQSLNDYLQGREPYSLPTCENVLFKLQDMAQSHFAGSPIVLQALHLEETRNNAVELQLA